MLISTSLLRYKWFNNPEIWLAKSIFEDVKLRVKVYKLFLCLMNLYLHAKNQVDFSIFSREITDLRTMQSDWLMGGPIYLTPYSSLPVII